MAGPVASNGLVKWNFRTGSLAESSPAVANGFVYIGDKDNNVYAIGNRTTAPVLKTLMAFNPFTVCAPPLLIDFGVPSYVSS